MIEQRFESVLDAPVADVWRRAVSVAGLKDEMRPLLRMTLPGNLQSLEDLDIQPPQMLYRSRLLLLGFIPGGVSELTMVDWQPGYRFVEQSPMTGMQSWQHTRTVVAEGDATRVIDELRYEPQVMAAITGKIVAWFFRHRHKRLRAYFSL
jgi:ligand-binding SRPBCC domain-containing protein